MNLTGQPAHVGRHCGSNVYKVDPQIVDFYADALDDHHPLYAEYAPPLLHHSECYKHLGGWYLQNLFGNLHARQDWELFSPIPVGAEIRSVSTIVDRFEKRGRCYVLNETSFFDTSDGRLLVRGLTHQSFLPSGSHEARDGSHEANDESPAPARPPFPTARGRELPGLRKVVDERRCWMFSGPGRNYHTDREQARKLGFPNIVVQGMMSTCFVSQLMQNEFALGWMTGGRMSLKLVNVLWVDEAVQICGRVADEVQEGTAMRVHCEVWADKEDGTRIALGTASAIQGLDTAP